MNRSPPIAVKYVLLSCEIQIPSDGCVESNAASAAQIPPTKWCTAAICNFASRSLYRAHLFQFGDAINLVSMWLLSALRSLRLRPHARTTRATGSNARPKLAIPFVSLGLFMRKAVLSFSSGAQKSVTRTPFARSSCVEGIRLGRHMASVLKKVQKKSKADEDRRRSEGERQRQEEEHRQEHEYHSSRQQKNKTLAYYLVQHSYTVSLIPVPHSDCM